jgi:H+/Cl- antiporter ClcA
VYAVLTGAGLHPVWHLGAAGNVHRVDLLWALAAGAAGAAVSVMFTYAAAGLRWLSRKIPAAIRPIGGGLALGLLAFWSPYALTFGEAQVNPLVARKALLAVFLIAAAAKFCGTVVTDRQHAGRDRDVWLAGPAHHPGRGHAVAAADQ